MAQERPGVVVVATERPVAAVREREFQEGGGAAVACLAGPKAFRREAPEIWGLAGSADVDPGGLVVDEKSLE